MWSVERIVLIIGAFATALTAATPLLIEMVRSWKKAGNESKQEPKLEVGVTVPAEKDYAGRYVASLEAQVKELKDENEELEARADQLKDELSAHGIPIPRPLKKE